MTIFTDYGSFNNREIAIALWSIALIALIIWKVNIREHIIGLIKIVVSRYILVPVTLLISYVVATIWLLQHFGLWNLSHLKTTVLWVLFSAFAAFFRIATTKEDPALFKTWLADNFKLIVLLEFVSNVYTLPLLGELILIPFVGILVMTATVASLKPETESAARVLNNLVALVGLGMITYMVSQVFVDASELMNVQTLRDFYIPPLLSLIFIPFLFGMYLYTLYDNTFRRLENFVIPDPSLRRFAKLQVLKTFNIHPHLLRRWQKDILFERPKTKEEVLDTIKHTITTLKREKNPPAVDPEIGWSPYLAAEFLKEFDLKTEGYRKVYGGWFVASPYRELGNGHLPNNLAYYIEGDEFAAKRLKLVLNINNISDARAAEESLLEAASVLATHSLVGVASGEVVKKLLLESNSSARLDSTLISVVREDYIGGIPDGYVKSFSIERISNDENVKL